MPFLYDMEPDKTALRTASLAPSSASCSHRCSHFVPTNLLLHLIPYAVKTSPGLAVSRIDFSHHNTSLHHRVSLLSPLISVMIQINLFSMVALFVVLECMERIKHSLDLECRLSSTVHAIKLTSLPYVLAARRSSFSWSGCTLLVFVALSESRTKNAM